MNLEGQHVSLVPLSIEHEEALVRAARDGELWKLTYTIVPSAEAMRAYIEKTLRAKDAGREDPFVIIDRARDAVAGSTRYMNIELDHRRREIGATWLARSAQRTAINTETKYLLLRHAFEVLRCVRVEFVTDVLNEPSRAALTRIGAIQEGVLRNHMIMPGGRYRDSACFSIIEAEWPAVSAALRGKLRQG